MTIQLHRKGYSDRISGSTILQRQRERERDLFLLTHQTSFGPGVYEHFEPLSDSEGNRGQNRVILKGETLGTKQAQSREEV